MTVTIIVATVVKRNVRNAKTAMGLVIQWVYVESGVRKIETKQQQAPVRNKPNIQWLATLTSFRSSMILEGRAMVAPERSSERRI